MKGVQTGTDHAVPITHLNSTLTKYSVQTNALCNLSIIISQK